jgi:hypothetical protein
MRRAWLEGPTIVFLCVVAAIVYGAVHDMVTAHVCVEYFTIGHERLFESDQPVYYALAWGVIATWWMGFLLGVPLLLASRVGRWPRLSAPDLVRPIGRLLLVMGTCALLAGIAGWVLASRQTILLNAWLAERVPADHHVRFLAVGAAHLASYWVSGIGGLGLSLWVIRRRRREARSSGGRGPR